MKTKSVLFVAMAALLAAGALLWTGCERSSSEDREITLTPATSELANNKNRIITFKASMGAVSTNDVATGLFYPLEWRVSNPVLGVILSSTGNQAIYQSAKSVEGVNIVTCRDQGGNEGSAVVVLSSP